MGHPKKQRKKYVKPKKPYDKERIEKEKKLLKQFGLRRKKEIWRAESMLRKIRRRARELQGVEDREKEKELLATLNKIGLIKENSLDAVLELTVEDILSRRLQTILYKKGLANTPLQARQFIVHGHVQIDDKKVTWPSYIVRIDEEEKIKLSNKINPSNFLCGSHGRKK